MKQKTTKDRKFISVKKLVIPVILIALIGAVIFAYREMSTMRRDLYGVRDDFYADDSAGEAEEGVVEHEILSQSVRNVRILDVDAPYNEYTGNVYKEVKIRSLKVSLVNNTEFPYTYNDVGFTYEDSNGRLISSINIHVDDDQNYKDTNISGNRDITLAKGGKATVYVYFIDPRHDITSVSIADYYGI